MVPPFACLGNSRHIDCVQSALAAVLFGRRIGVSTPPFRRRGIHDCHNRSGVTHDGSCRRYFPFDGLRFSRFADRTNCDQPNFSRKVGSTTSLSCLSFKFDNPIVLCWSKHRYPMVTRTVRGLISMAPNLDWEFTRRINNFNASTIRTLHFAFRILHSAFCLLPSAFFLPHSSFSTPLYGIIPPMQPTIIGVRFTKIGKVYHFDGSAVPDVQVGEHVIVDTSRGRNL